MPATTERPTDVPGYTPPTDCFPMGAVEIAKLLGVKRQTVNQWVFRNHMPEPLWVVSGMPAWDRAQIVAWAKLTGRWED